MHTVTAIQSEAVQYAKYYYWKKAQPRICSLYVPIRKTSKIDISRFPDDLQWTKTYMNFISRIFPTQLVTASIQTKVVEERFNCVYCIDYNSSLVHILHILIYCDTRSDCINLLPLKNLNIGNLTTQKTDIKIGNLTKICIK